MKNKNTKQNKESKNCQTRQDHNLPKAKKPFVFHTTMRLHEATTHKARNLRELSEGIRKVDGSVIFHHTYGSILRYQFLIPAPVSDFAFWVKHILHDELMAEKLSAIDTISYSTIAEIRDAHIKAIEAHLDHNNCATKASPIHEFHFVKDNSFVFPTDDVAWTLRDFRRCLEKVTNGSLYFHLFEAKLRLEKPSNDFSFWLGENFNEEKLAQFIARQDPYVQTLDQIKMKIIRELDKRLAELQEG